MSGGCLGDVAAALVDGELDDAGRERAHRHLAHCAGCRAEVDGQRRLKVRLSGVDEPSLPGALSDRLLRMTVPLHGSAAREVRSPSRPVTATPTASRPTASRPTANRLTANRLTANRLTANRPAGSHPRGPRPTGSRARGVVHRRAGAGSAFVLLGVAAALALGAPQPRPATTPVDPGTDAFVTEFVSTTADGGTSSVVPVPAARPAGLTTFVPLTRTALLSTGGARTTR